MSGPAALSKLVAELHGLTRRTGKLRPEEMAELGTLLDLPVYSNDPAAAMKLLHADLLSAIKTDLDRDDRIIAEYLFRQKCSELDIRGRQAEAVKAIPLASRRQLRYPRDDWVLGQIAYALYRAAMSPERSGWHHGDGYIFVDFTIDTFPDATLTKRTTRYSFTIRSVRDRVEFYKFGTLVKGSKKSGKPRLVSKGKSQHYVASMPVDERSPSAGAWHIVRFSPKLSFGSEPTIVLEEDTALLQPKDQMREAGLTVAGLDPVARQLELTPSALLRVHIPRAVVPQYTRNTYSLVGDVMDRPISEELVERVDDAPMTFCPDPVIPERRYVVDWSALFE